MDSLSCGQEFVLCSFLELDPHCNGQFGSWNKYITKVLLSIFHQLMTFDDLNESTIVEMTKYSSGEIKDDDVSYIPSMIFFRGSWFWLHWFRLAQISK